MHGYSIPIFLFERGLALCNFIAFLSFHVQLRGTVMSRGITPASTTMKRFQQMSDLRRKWKVFCWKNRRLLKTTSYRH